MPISAMQFLFLPAICLLFSYPVIAGVMRNAPSEMEPTFKRNALPVSRPSENATSANETVDWINANMKKGLIAVCKNNSRGFTDVETSTSLELTTGKMNVKIKDIHDRFQPNERTDLYNFSFRVADLLNEVRYDVYEKLQRANCEGEAPDFRTMRVYLSCAKPNCIQSDRGAFSSSIDIFIGYEVDPKRIVNAFNYLLKIGGAKAPLF